MSYIVFIMILGINKEKVKEETRVAIKPTNVEQLKLKAFDYLVT